MVRAAALWVLSALPLAAEEGAAQAAFADWARGAGTTGALQSATRSGGDWTVAGERVRGELASVSKSITAICALALVEEGALSWSDTVADRLGKGPETSAAQLVTHSSGLVHDATQVAMRLWVDRPATPEGHTAQAVLGIVAARGTPAGPPNSYAYNNENYALLALMIEQASGQNYVDACWPRLGLNDAIAPSARTGAFAPWGGLYADSAGYLAFLHRHFGPGSLVYDDPFAYPHVEIGAGAYYGLGMLFRAAGDGYTFWHHGAHCFPGRLNVGSFALLWQGRFSALALYEGCLGRDGLAALEMAVTRSIPGQAQ